MLRSLWKLQWKQFAARMKKGNGKKTSGGWLVFLMLFFVVCMEILMFVVFAELVPLCEMGLTWLYFAMTRKTTHGCFPCRYRQSTFS